MTLVAASMKLRLSTLDTNGKLRDARSTEQFWPAWAEIRSAAILIGHPDIEVRLQIEADRARIADCAERTGDIELAVLMLLGSHRLDEAARLAETAGLKVVMNRCPKIELFRPFWKPRLNQAI